MGGGGMSIDHLLKVSYLRVAAEDVGVGREDGVRVGSGRRLEHAEKCKCSVLIG